MIGLDGDTRETLEDMVQQLIRLRVSYAVFYTLMLLPGTQLREQFIKENRIKDHNWDHQNGTEITFKSKSFKQEELQDYYWELYNKFYSYKSIIKRIFTSANLNGGINSILIPLKTNLFFQKRVKNRLHPIEN